MNRSSEQPGAVITGGHFLSLGAVRNLARHGVRVCVVDHEVCVAQFSRSTWRFSKCPPARHEAGFVEFLLSIAHDAGMKGWVLFPSTDEHVRLLSQHRSRLSEHYIVTTPPWDIIKFLYDNRRVPRAHLPASPRCKWLVEYL